MSARWKRVRLGEVMRHRKEFITIDDATTYRRPRVQLHAKGIVLRDEVAGARIKTKKQQVCNAGEFLVAEIDAKVGGFGIVPPPLHGAIVSSHYFLFVLDETQLDPGFLRYYVETRSFREQVEAQGSTNYASIRPCDVLRYEIPLPPLDEQRRIVARIEQFAGKIREARKRLDETTAAAEALLRAALAEGQCYATPMRELVRLRNPDVVVHPQEVYQFAGVFSFGRGVFRAQERLGAEFSYPRLTRLRVGDFVYPKLMAWEGALGIVPKECDGCVVSPEFSVFEVGCGKILPEILETYFRDPRTWPALAGASTGTNVRRRRLQPQHLLAHMVPLPAPHAQRRFRLLHSKVMESNRFRRRTAAELDALLPSILHRAFNGEL